MLSPLQIGFLDLVNDAEDTSGVKAPWQRTSMLQGLLARHLIQYFLI